MEDLPKDLAALLLLVFFHPHQPPLVGSQATGSDLVDVVDLMVLVSWFATMVLVAVWLVGPCRWRWGPFGRAGCAGSAGTGGGAASAGRGWGGTGRGELGGGSCRRLLMIQMFCCWQTQSWFTISQFCSHNSTQRWQIRDGLVFSKTPGLPADLSQRPQSEDTIIWEGIEGTRPALFADQLWLDGEWGLDLDSASDGACAMVQPTLWRDQVRQCCRLVSLKNSLESSLCTRVTSAGMTFQCWLKTRWSAVLVKQNQNRGSTRGWNSQIGWRILAVHFDQQLTHNFSLVANCSVHTHPH